MSCFNVEFIEMLTNVVICILRVLHPYSLTLYECLCKPARTSEFLDFLLIWACQLCQRAGRHWTEKGRTNVVTLRSRGQDVVSLVGIPFSGLMMHSSSSCSGWFLLCLLFLSVIQL